MLFNLLIANIEQGLRNDEVGGVKLGGRKKVLGYTDDLVILAEEEKDLRWLMKRLQSYMDKKGLRVNTEKTNIIKFKKGGGGGGN